MARRDEIIAYANELLDLAAFKDRAPGTSGGRRGGGDASRLLGLGIAGAVPAGRRRRSAARDRPSRPALGQRAARDRRARAAAAPGPVRGGHQPRRLSPRARRPSRDRQQRAARAGVGVEVDGPFLELGLGGSVSTTRDEFLARVRERIGREPLVFAEVRTSSGASRSSPAAGRATYRRRPPRVTTSFSPENRPSRASISPGSSGSTSLPPGTTRPRSSVSRRSPTSSPSGSISSGSSSSCRTLFERVARREYSPCVMHRPEERDL